MNTGNPENSDSSWNLSWLPCRGLWICTVALAATLRWVKCLEGGGGCDIGWSCIELVLPFFGPGLGGLPALRSTGKSEWSPVRMLHLAHGRAQPVHNG